MKQFMKWAEKEYGIGMRILATLTAGVLFVVLILWVLSRVDPNLDYRLDLPSIAFGLPTSFLGGILILFGLFYALWAINAQLFLARGTPLPMMATKKMLITGSFKHCRNPMSFGAITLYRLWDCPGINIRCNYGPFVCDNAHHLYQTNRRAGIGNSVRGSVSSL
jgi:protein-S-isoprenylcysteine O-methyltransferase Ste14